MERKNPSPLGKKDVEKEWMRLVTVLRNSGINLTHLAAFGSVSPVVFRSERDMDLLFTVAGDPHPKTFNLQLLAMIERHIPDAHIQPGKLYQILHVDFPSHVTIDVILLPTWKFQNRQYRDIF